jgi:hypothetical protein
MIPAGGGSKARPPRPDALRSIRGRCYDWPSEPLPKEKPMAEKTDNPKGRDYEEKGLVTDVLVPIGQGVASGLGAAWGSAKLNEGKKPKETSE